MTKEEAVKWIKTAMDNYDFFPETEEVLKLAIESLSAEELVRCEYCQHRKKVGTSYYCELDEFSVKDTDFCS